MTDKDFLKRAITIGNRKEQPYNFGAVIVQDNKILAESESMVYESLDPSAHAEILALRKACKAYGKYPLDGATMYSSHEPCVMCFSCAVWAGVSRVVYVAVASELKNFRYEFQDITLEFLANHSVRQNVRVDRMTVKL